MSRKETLPSVLEHFYHIFEHCIPLLAFAVVKFDDREGHYPLAMFLAALNLRTKRRLLHNSLLLLLFVSTHQTHGVNYLSMCILFIT